MKGRKHLWGILYGTALTAFTVYFLLDTFVLARVYSHAPSDSNVRYGNSADSDTDNSSISDSNVNKSDISDFNIDNSDASDSKTDNSGITGSNTQRGDISGSEIIINENTYSDEHISVTIKEYREFDTSINVADVSLSSAEYLKTALAQGAYGKNVTEKTSEIAESNHAILAINGDYYGAREKGYVLRNGVIYRSTASANQEDLVIYEEGSFSVITEGEVSAEELLSGGARQILSFGPALVTDGKISVTEDAEVGKAKASNPRTAIGIVNDLHYLFVVSDGRTEESAGLTLYELAEVLQALGAAIAYNLDGGGSSTMYFNGEVVNHPTTSGRSIKERSVSDIVYIGY